MTVLKEWSERGGRGDAAFPLFKNRVADLACFDGRSGFRFKPKALFESCWAETAQ